MRGSMLGGRAFIHEHPAGASSWGLGMVKAIIELLGVYRVHVDQCMYGQSVTTSEGQALCRKPTVFMTNSVRIAQSIGPSWYGVADHEIRRGLLWYGLADRGDP